MKVPGITDEELVLIRSVILLLITRRILQRDARVLKECSALRNPELYTDMIHIAEQRACLIQEEIGAELQQLGITLIGLHQDDQGVEAEYLCREYRGHMKIPWQALQRETSFRIRAYLGSAGVPLPM
ncbi:hypothetical protein QYF50_15945 [Paenibacillus vini]|uniref:hypothetical protein n=1 Tax=Paenibacillus vini TaxID=1476024 RepID=UPI0025B6D2F4|nr:hypothetical protein [Paenibacillus vini]MDN4069392.1 hypothetical protein [Paenibacillus vini]